MERAATAYLILGLAATSERHARSAVSTCRTIAGTAMFPASRVWRSAVAAPARARARDAASSLERDGRQIVASVRRLGYEAASPMVERLAARLAEERVVERTVSELTARGTIARVAEQLIEAGVAGEVMDGRLVDQVTDQVLASDEMRRVLEYVTKSPELRAALAEQGAGLAEDMAVGVRARTSAADAAAERVVRSLIRRRR